MFLKSRSTYEHLLFLTVVFFLTLFGVNSLAEHYVYGMTVPHAVDPSDIHWTYAFLKDIVTDGGRITQWHFSHHSDMFPDKLIGLFWYLVTPTKELFYLFYAFTNWLLWYFFVNVLSRSRYIAFISTILPLALVKTAIGLQIFPYAFWPTYHFSTMVLAYLSLYYFLSSKGQKRRYLWGSSLFLIFVSDKLVIIYVMSLLGSDIFLRMAAREKITWKNVVPKEWWKIVGIITAAWLFQNKFFKLLGAYSGVSQQDMSILFQNIERWYVIISLILLLLALLFKGVVWDYYKNLKDKDSFLFRVIFGALFIPFVMSLKFDIQIRYAAPVIYFSILALACLLVKIASKRKYGLMTFLILLVSGIMIARFNSAKLVAFEKHSIATCLEEISKKRPLKSGLSWHWMTHAINVNGNEKHPIRSLYIRDLTAYHWVNSRDWFNDQFNFYVEHPGIGLVINRNLFKNFFEGSPERVECKDGAVVYVLNEVQEKQLNSVFTPPR